MNSAAPPNPAPPAPLADPVAPTFVLFSFRGRVPRKAYWLYGVLGPVLMSVILQLLLGIVGMAERPADVAISLLLIWPCTAVAVKRWHDRDKSGWWVLINLIPLVGVIWSQVENGFLRGSVGPNRFGADPSGQF